MKIRSIPASAIQHAKSTLNVAYWHASHGNQILNGMTNLDSFMGNTSLYTWHNGQLAGSLNIIDKYGQIDSHGGTGWYNETRTFLLNPVNASINVVVWAWCSAISSNTISDDNTYLYYMSLLEQEFPQIQFVYMTGRRDIWSDDIVKRNNEIIRQYCITNNKLLYDFADIESYDPDLTYYEYTNDNCDVYSDAGNHYLGNWAVSWQNANPGWWYDCTSEHSYPINANQKAYAAWWLWASLAGWDNQASAKKVQNATTEEITFPAQKLTIQFVNAGNTAQTVLTAVRVNETPSICSPMPEGISSLFSSCYWIVNSYRGDVGAYKICFDLTGLLDTTRFSSIHVVKRQNENYPWEDISSKITSRAYPILTLNNMSSFSEFAFAFPIETLPVVLSSFTVEQIDNRAISLRWTTESESNMLGYTIHRANSLSYDQSLIVNNDIIPAHNNATTTSYSYIDTSITQPGTYYYWLESADLNGEKKSYGPITLSFEQGQDNEIPEGVTQNSLSVYPNPFNPNTTICYQSNAQDKLEIEIFNCKGELVRKMNRTVQEGTNNLVWNGRDDKNQVVKTGIYFCRAKTATVTKMIKLMMIK